MDEEELMIIIVSPLQFFLGLCIVGAVAFGVGVALGADVTREDEKKPR